MFDIFNFKDASENPLLAAEFVKVIPAYELVKHLLKAYSDKPTFGSPKLLIDIPAIRDGILASGRDDLQLVLATYGEVTEFWEPKALEQLAAKGPAFKAALLRNTRIDWYNLSTSDERVSIFQDTLLADIDDPTNKSLLYAMVRNPRMDRRVIADAMRGIDGFETLSIRTRLLIGAEAIGVKEIPAEYWAGKDAPDSHELHFTKVNDAFIPMIREAKEALDEREFERAITSLLWKLPGAELSLRAEDWLGAEEIQSIKEKSSNRGDYGHAALYKVFEFFGSWYSGDDGYPQTHRLIGIAGVAIMAMTSLTRSHAVVNDVESIVQDMLISPHLIVRAAGYATIFNNIAIKPDSPQVKDFFSSYPENSLEKWMGITNTPAFWLCWCEHGSLLRTISEEMAGSGYEVKIEKAREDTYQFLFYSGSHGDSYEEHVAAHNKTTRPKLFRSKNTVAQSSHRAFAVEGSKVESHQESKNLLQRFFR